MLFLFTRLNPKLLGHTLFDIDIPSFPDIFRTIGGLLCKFIYELIVNLYNLFMNIAQISFINQGDLKTIYQKITLILTMIMVFYVTFETVKYVIQPDTITDKERGASKIVTKMILVVLLIAMVPTIFEYSRKLQKGIIDSNLIANIFLNTTGHSSEDTGKNFSADLLSVFYADNYPGGDPRGDYSGCNIPDRGAEPIKKCYDNGSTLGRVSSNLKDLRDTGTIPYLGRGLWEYNENDNNKYMIKFEWLLAFAVGAFIVYVLALYCIDAGVRVAQLAFLEIIAPIPIIGYLSPKKDGMFEKWVKQCITTYIDLFIRMMILYIVFLIANMLGTAYGNGTGRLFDGLNPAPSDTMKMFIYIALILGLFLFAQKAPKLLQELLPKGSSAASGNFGLKAGERVAPGAARTIGAALGGARGLRRGLGGLGNKIRNRRDMKDEMLARGEKPTWRNIHRNRRDARRNNREANKDVRAARKELREALSSGDQARIKKAQDNFSAKKIEQANKMNELATRRNEAMKFGGVMGSTIVGTTVGSTIAGAAKGTTIGVKAKKLEEIHKQVKEVSKTNKEVNKTNEAYVQSGGTGTVDRIVTKAEQSLGISTKAERMEREIKKMEAIAKSKENVSATEQSVVKAQDEIQGIDIKKIQEGTLKTTAANDEEIVFSDKSKLTIPKGTKYSEVFKDVEREAAEAEQELKHAIDSGTAVEIANARTRYDKAKTQQAQIGKALHKKVLDQYLAAIAQYESGASSEDPRLNANFESGAVSKTFDMLEAIRNARSNVDTVKRMEAYIEAKCKSDPSNESLYREALEAFKGAKQIDNFSIYDEIEKGLKNVSGSRAPEISAIKTEQQIISTGAAMDAAKAADAASGGKK